MTDDFSNDPWYEGGESMTTPVREQGKSSVTPRPIAQSRTRKTRTTMSREQKHIALTRVQAGEQPMDVAADLGIDRNELWDLILTHVYVRGLHYWMLKDYPAWASLIEVEANFKAQRKLEDALVALRS